MSIHELAGRYGNVIDDRDTAVRSIAVRPRSWDGLGRVFTEDAVFELRGLGPDERLQGLGAIRRKMAESTDHPVTHHVTNVGVHDDDDLVRLFFKLRGPGRRGRVGSADYHDVVRREAHGWRICEHRVTLRTSPEG